MSDPQVIKHVEETFGDFRARLTKAQSPSETAKHATSMPVFEVRRHVIMPGFEKKFAKGMCLFDARGKVTIDPDVAFKALTDFEPTTPVTDTTMLENEPHLVDCIKDLKGSAFSELAVKDKWDVLEVMIEHSDTKSITGYSEISELVSVHMTPQAAEKALNRTRCLTNERLAIRVGSKWDDQEYKMLVDCIVGGFLDVKDPDAA